MGHCQAGIARPHLDAGEEDQQRHGGHDLRHHQRLVDGGEDKGETRKGSRPCRRQGGHGGDEEGTLHVDPVEDEKGTGAGSESEAKSLSGRCLLPACSASGWAGEAPGLMLARNIQGMTSARCGR